MATNYSGLNSAYLLVTEERRERERKQRQGARRGSLKRSVYAASGDLCPDS